MALILSEELRFPGLRLRHPPNAEIETEQMETRRFVVHRLGIRSPWLTSESDPSQAGRYRIRALVFEGRDGAPVGDLLPEGRMAPGTKSPELPGDHQLVEGELGGREALLRRPKDSREPRAAYLTVAPWFVFVEWEGPADAILATLVFEPGG